jgi:hypothetical protein
VKCEECTMWAESDLGVKNIMLVGSDLDVRSIMSHLGCWACGQERQEHFIPPAPQ